LEKTLISLGGRYYSEEELKSAGFKRIGKNVKIHNRASIYHPENISIGDNVRIDDFTVIIATGEVDIGNYVQIANFCFIGAKFGFFMEDFSTLAPRVAVFTASDDYSGEYMTNPTVPNEFTGGKKGKVVIKKHAIVGTGSVLLPNITIAEGTSIGALALVRKNTQPWEIYSGVPARIILSRKKDLLKYEKLKKLANIND
jgi:acetyltransferase-like isoleucine patch superfamily enzyme